MFPFTRGVAGATTLPFVAASYHLTVPVAVTAILATVGLEVEQNDCGVVPDGAAGTGVTVTTTAALLTVPHQGKPPSFVTIL